MRILTRTVSSHLYEDAHSSVIVIRDFLAVSQCNNAPAPSHRQHGPCVGASATSLAIFQQPAQALLTSKRHTHDFSHLAARLRISSTHTLKALGVFARHNNPPAGVSFRDVVAPRETAGPLGRRLLPHFRQRPSPRQSK
jgi:hypothetical protein